jgi:hypothetical protein
MFLPFPFGETQRAHLTILAQKAEIVQPMVGGFFTTRNPCKHWPKRVSGAFLSSMFLDKHPQNHPVFNAKGIRRKGIGVFSSQAGTSARLFLAALRLCPLRLVFSSLGGEADLFVDLLVDRASGARQTKCGHARNRPVSDPFLKRGDRWALERLQMLDTMEAEDVL